ncbi:hypothetical protein B0H19DRAFT_1069258 [Mycena capillaripes]|nr:hypothetical protein B0H19DRAFT_1069258 [Mycena capillaripes]
MAVELVGEWVELPFQSGGPWFTGAINTQTAIETILRAADIDKVFETRFPETFPQHTSRPRRLPSSNVCPKPLTLGARTSHHESVCGHRPSSRTPASLRPRYTVPQSFKRKGREQTQAPLRFRATARPRRALAYLAAGINSREGHEDGACASESGSFGRGGLEEGGVCSLAVIPYALMVFPPAPRQHQVQASHWEPPRRERKVLCLGDKVTGVEDGVLHVAEVTLKMACIKARHPVGEVGETLSVGGSASRGVESGSTVHRKKRQRRRIAAPCR